MTDSIALSIDGQPIEARPREPVREAARRAGIEIPTLCYHPDLSPAGSCRLCLIEVEGRSSQAPACTLPVMPGMQVRTQTPGLRHSRRMVLSFLLSRFHDAGSTDPAAETEFMHWVRPADQRHVALRIGEGAILLRPGDARQQHIGILAAGEA